jgi:hypothetical protein
LFAASSFSLQNPDTFHCALRWFDCFPHNLSLSLCW